MVELSEITWLFFDEIITEALAQTTIVGPHLIGLDLIYFMFCVNIFHDHQVQLWQ